MSRHRHGIALMAASAISMMIDPAMASAARTTNNVKNLDDFGGGASALTFASDGLDTTGSGSGVTIDRHHTASDLGSTKMATTTSIAGVGDDLPGDGTTRDGTGHIAPS